MEYETLCASVKIKRERLDSGSTAVCALVFPDCIYIANCGDSRAVLCRGGIPVVSTKDHKPKDPEEKARIEAAGGSVHGNRVMAVLAVSRALGDIDLKGIQNCKSLSIV